jgi:hypothetical protein
MAAARPPNLLGVRKAPEVAERLFDLCGSRQ